MDSTSELRRFLYLLVNLGLIAIAVLFSRRVFVVFGSLGVRALLSVVPDRVRALLPPARRDA